MNELKDFKKSVDELRGLIGDVPTSIEIIDEYGCDDVVLANKNLDRVIILLERIETGLPKVEAHLKKLLKS